MIGAARRAMLFEKELLSMNQGEKQNLGESINAFIAKSNPSPMMKAEFFVRRRLTKCSMYQVVCWHPWSWE